MLAQKLKFLFSDTFPFRWLMCISVRGKPAFWLSAVSRGTSGLAIFGLHGPSVQKSSVATWRTCGPHFPGSVTAWCNPPWRSYSRFTFSVGAERGHTEREADLVAHSQQLSKVNLVLGWWEAHLIHPEREHAHVQGRLYNLNLHRCSILEVIG